MFEINRMGEIARHFLQNPRMLGLTARDAALFDTSTSFSRHRSSIVSRDRAILLRMVGGSVQAIIRADRTLIFEPTRETNRVAEAVVERLKSSAHTSYELRMLEALLAEASGRFQKRLRWLGPLVERVLADLTASDSVGSTEISVKLFRKLLPLKRALSEMASDVKEAYEAIDEIAENDEASAK